ncbi:hypothetical protein [Parapedobacter indicus]|uniref:Uncharacterized protein n=1 Tax=Parapedobacter indicus TaxID=1477437 RepID=A0A1I3HE71_9SPHI|nr:hypothetical protein [Parapedobacter indicus]PPL03003.1 hypothetical protein CLV26_103329 [Parapedobacter indicus]SFI34068.1 hypothetical protein SAMN05444682_103328 [Parapedobacter indicus]
MNKKTIDGPSNYMEMFGLLAESNASLRHIVDLPAEVRQPTPTIELEIEGLDYFAHLFSLLACD